MENPALPSLYEDFAVYPVRFCKGENPTPVRYAAPSSLHSPVTREYYGKAIVMDALRLTDGAVAAGEVTLPDLAGRRCYLKLRCLLEDRQKLVNHIRVEVNGQTVFESGEAFWETVNLGWPAVYYPVAGFAQGRNRIAVSSDDRTGAGLMLGDAAVVCLPAFRPFGQISSLRVVRLGQPFLVAVYTGGAPVGRVQTEGADLQWSAPSPLSPEVWHFGLVARTTAPAATAWLGEQGAPVPLCLPQVVDVAGEQCQVGIDCDDHRHDHSEEATRVLEVFAYTGMGNYFQFRPNLGRNYHTFPDREVWERRYRFLREAGAWISLKEKEGRRMMPFAREFAADRYAGLHIHEPYLYFCPLLENSNVNKEFVVSGELIRGCADFAGADKLFRDFLARLYQDRREKYGAISVGMPSLLCMIEGDSEMVDKLVAEPVSNCSLLFGAVRGIARQRGKPWGAHLPPDWYFGLPVDACKARKVRLAMQLAYLQGAGTIYLENSVLKTNAFSREDWESPYTGAVRTCLRQVADYTVRHPRPGPPVVENAVMYGRLDHFYWQLDDRMAELRDTGDWDRLMWGKWEDDTSRWCWRALDAWLPPAARQVSCQHVVNTQLFSGTPYGEVDVVPHDGDLAPYRRLALLGFNAMEPRQFERLRAFVEQGGELFLSLCHFNMATVPGKRDFFANEGVWDFLGAKAAETGRQAHRTVYDDGFSTAEGEGLEVAALALGGARVLARCENQQPLFLCNRYGKGRVYWGAFRDYPAQPWAVSAARHLMEQMGAHAEVRVDNPNVFFSRRVRDGRQVVHLLNMNCADEGASEAFTLHYGGGSLQGSVREGEIAEYIL